MAAVRAEPYDFVFQPEHVAQGGIFGWVGNSAALLRASAGRRSAELPTQPNAALRDVLAETRSHKVCANRWHSFSSSMPSCCVSSSEVLAPAAEFGDVARLGGGMRFAEKAFDLCAILDLDIADRERWGYSGQKTA